MGVFRMGFRAGLGGVIVAFAVASAATGGFAQETKTILALPPAPLLPQMIGKLTRAAEGDSGDGLSSVDVADAAVLQEDGLRRFARSVYSGDSAQHGTITVYKFMDASGARAAFDYFRRPEVHIDHKLGDAASSDHQGRVILSGVNIVREDLNKGGEELMPELISKLPKAGGTAALLPLLPTYLPAKGLQTDSVRYALGPQGL